MGQKGGWWVGDGLEALMFAQTALFINSAHYLQTEDCGFSLPTLFNTVVVSCLWHYLSSSRSTCLEISQSASSSLLSRFEAKPIQQ